MARAGVDGMLALKNELAFVYRAGGDMRPIRADLDFRLIKSDGKVAFVDTKSFAGEYFTYSQLDPRQLQRALVYATHRVPAGFVVWLNKADQVVFYSAHVVAEAGPGSRFTAAQGVLLGGPLTFSLQGVFA